MYLRYSDMPRSTSKVEKYLAEIMFYVPYLSGDK